jgi:hypothetical protein
MPLSPPQAVLPNSIRTRMKWWLEDRGEWTLTKHQFMYSFIAIYATSILQSTEQGRQGLFRFWSSTFRWYVIINWENLLKKPSKNFFQVSSARRQILAHTVIFHHQIPNPHTHIFTYPIPLPSLPSFRPQHWETKLLNDYKAKGDAPLSGYMFTKGPSDYRAAGTSYLSAALR